MAKVHEQVLTERHLALFGAILQCFARYELTIEQSIAYILRTDPSSIAILMRHLDFMGKRLALLDLLRLRAVPADQWERIFAHLAVPSCHVNLRDHITHSTWMTSPEPKSIQPSWILRWNPRIEPTLQTTADESNYTLEALNEVATNLANSHEQFDAFLAETGLI